MNLQTITLNFIRQIAVAISLYEFPTEHLAALQTKDVVGENNALKIPMSNICNPYNLDEFGGINIATLCGSCIRR